MPIMIRDPEALVRDVLQIHAAIRDEVLAACERVPATTLSRVAADEGPDTIFAIDRVSEASLLARLSGLARERPCVLIGEGLGTRGEVVLPRGSDPLRAELRVLFDPIDGTRGLMYQKRSAWILTGIAPNRGPRTNLGDIEIAVQTEIPLLKQNQCDTLWAIAGQGAHGERLDRISGERISLRLQPSQATSIEQGYGSVTQFFPGAAAELAALEDEVVTRILGPIRPGAALCFADQCAATGGQLYELVMGHDRWIADLRALLEVKLRSRGRSLGLCCHPYDLCTELIAREAGVIVTDERGRRLSSPFDVGTNVSWLGYANAAIRDQVAAVLLPLLEERGLLTGGG
jgi:hypothetical protein